MEINVMFELNISSHFHLINEFVLVMAKMILRISLEQETTVTTNF